MDALEELAALEAQIQQLHFEQQTVKAREWTEKIEPLLPLTIPTEQGEVIIESITQIGNVVSLGGNADHENQISDGLLIANPPLNVDEEGNTNPVEALVDIIQDL